MTILYDITPPISSDTAVWPGDVAPTRHLAFDMKTGDHITVSSLTTTVHVGAHADAPLHFLSEGGDIAAVSLEPYMGPCQVIRILAPPSTALKPKDLPRTLTQPRVLIDTGTFPDPYRFTPGFAYPTPQLVRFLAESNVVLFGTDAPSVDAVDSKDLPSHHAMFARGIAILEGLVLAEVPEGEYELVSLPLPLTGFDASPVRAVLRALP